MALTLAEWMDALERGETEERYRARHKKLRKLTDERDELEDGIAVLKAHGNCEKDYHNLVKKSARLKKVLMAINELQ